MPKALVYYTFALWLLQTKKPEHFTRFRLHQEGEKQGASNIRIPQITSSMIGDLLR